MIDPKLAKTVNLLAEPTSIIEAFDPALGKSIDHEYIISQAQERLKGRSQDELEAGTRYAAELLRQAEASAKSSALKQMQAGTNQVYLNDPLAFIELFERFELDKREDFSDAEPITYFSLIALNFALESLDASRRAGDPSGNPSKDPMEQAVREHAKRFVQERANDAKELLAFTHGMEFEGIFRRKTASKAGQTRQAQFDPLKEKILQYSDEHCANMSNRKAANKAYERYREEADSVLRTDDPVKRFEVWIGKHRRAQKRS